MLDKIFKQYTVWHWVFQFLLAGGLLYLVSILNSVEQKQKVFAVIAIGVIALTFILMLIPFWTKLNNDNYQNQFNSTCLLIYKKMHELQVGEKISIDDNPSDTRFYSDLCDEFDKFPNFELRIDQSLEKITLKRIA